MITLPRPHHFQQDYSRYRVCCVKLSEGHPSLSSATRICLTITETEHGGLWFRLTRLSGVMCIKMFLMRTPQWLQLTKCNVGFIIIIVVLVVIVTYLLHLSFHSVGVVLNTSTDKTNNK